MVDQLFSLLSRPCSISSAAYLYPVDGGIARYSRQVQRAISVENRPAGGCDERTTSWKTEQMSSCLNSRPVSPLFSTGCCCVSCCPFSYHPPPFCCYHSSYFAPMCFSPPFALLFQCATSPSLSFSSFGQQILGLRPPKGPQVHPAIERPFLTRQQKRPIAVPLPIAANVSQWHLLVAGGSRYLRPILRHHQRRPCVGLPSPPSSSESKCVFW